METAAMGKFIQFRIDRALPKPDPLKCDWDTAVWKEVWRKSSTDTYLQVQKSSNRVTNLHRVTNLYRYHSPGRLRDPFGSNGRQRRHIFPFSRTISRGMSFGILLSKYAAVHSRCSVVWSANSISRCLWKWRNTAPFSRAEIGRSPWVQGWAVQCGGRWPRIPLPKIDWW